MTPEERAETLRQAIQMNIEPVETEGAGHYWMLSASGFARIASAIRDAENDAFERAAELCHAASQEHPITYSQFLGPDYLVARTLAARELAAAIRELKHKESGSSATS